MLRDPEEWPQDHGLTGSRFTVHGCRLLVSINVIGFWWEGVPGTTPPTHVPAESFPFVVGLFYLMKCGLLTCKCAVCPRIKLEHCLLPTRFLFLASLSRFFFSFLVNFRFREAKPSGASRVSHPCFFDSNEGGFDSQSSPISLTLANIQATAYLWGVWWTPVKCVVCWCNLQDSSLGTFLQISQLEDDGKFFAAKSSVKRKVFLI